MSISKNLRLFVFCFFFISLFSENLFCLDESSGELSKSEANKEEAILHFKKGVEFYKAKDYAPALAEFLKSFELQPNWAVRFNIAVCYMETGKILEALDEFQKYLEEGKERVPANRRKEVEEYIKKIESKIGYIKVESNEDGAIVSLDEFHEYKTPLSEPIPVVAGVYSIIAKKDGFIPFKKEITVATGETVTLNILLKPVQEEGIESEPKPVIKKEEVKVKKGEISKKKFWKKPRNFLWIGLGTGAAFAGGAIALGVISNHYKDKMQESADKCESTVTREDCPDAYEYKDKARQFSIGSDVMTAFAIVSATAFITTFAVLFAIEKSKKGKSKEKSSSFLKNVKIAAGFNKDFIAEFRF